MTEAADNSLSDVHYTLTKRRMKLFSEFTGVDAEGNEILFGKQEPGLGKSVFDVFRHEGDAAPVYRIHRTGLSLSEFRFDLFEVEGDSEKKVGTLARKFLESMLRDHWLILDADGNQIGEILEDSTALAILRRTVLDALTQAFFVTVHGQKIAEYRRKYMKFNQTTDIHILPACDQVYDRKLAVMLGMMLGIYDAKDEH